MKVLWLINSCGRVRRYSMISRWLCWTASIKTVNPLPSIAYKIVGKKRKGMKKKHSIILDSLKKERNNHWLISSSLLQYLHSHLCYRLLLRHSFSIVVDPWFGNGRWFLTSLILSSVWWKGFLSSIKISHKSWISEGYFMDFHGFCEILIEFFFQ